jgi:phage baseplate assembly protein gpV
MSFAPSSLFRMAEYEGTDSFDQTYNNTALRIGIVLKVVDIEDEENENKIVPEYDVMALENDPENGLNSTIYKQCISFDGFGGVADFFQMKLRPVKDAKKTQQKLNLKDETGSLVLLLCIDGQSDRAMIIKSFPSQEKSILTKEKGIHLEGEYNGINYQINKDGELTVTFRSATEDDGTPKDEEAGGTFLKIDKTGSFEVNSGNKESIKIDKKEKTISVNAEKDISVSTEANIAITSKENATLTIKDLIANAEGKISFTSASPSVFKSDAEITLDAPTVNINGQDMVMVKAQQIQLQGSQVMVGNGATPAVVQTTLFQGVGNLGGPVICQAIGPFSTSVMIGA